MRAARVVAALGALAACSSAEAPKPEWVASDAACGGERQDDCPLEQWMGATLLPAVQDGDFAALEHGFAQLDLELPGAPRWRAIVRAGLGHIEARDLEAVRRTCKECHEGLRDRFRRDHHGHFMRTR